MNSSLPPQWEGHNITGFNYSNRDRRSTSSEEYIGLRKDHLHRYEFYHFIIPLKMSRAARKAETAAYHVPFILNISMPSPSIIPFFGKAVALSVIFCLWEALGFCHLRSHWVLIQLPLTETGYWQQKSDQFQGEHRLLSQTKTNWIWNSLEVSPSSVLNLEPSASLSKISNILQITAGLFKREIIWES